MHNYSMPPMNREEFTTALHHGRGSAFLHIRDHGSDDLFEIILDACLFDRAFDSQCEGPREKWLHSLIAHDEKICAAIVESFEEPSEEKDHFQVANLVGLIAVNGNRAAAAALRRSWTENDLAGEAAIIMLDGLPAAIEVVRCLGQRLISDPDEYVDGLEYLIEDEMLRAQVMQELEILAPHDTAIKAYLTSHQVEVAKRVEDDAMTSEQRAQRRRAYQREYLAEYPLARIVELAKSPDNVSAHIFRRFGRWAGDSERQQVLQILESEPAPEVQRRLLTIFGSEGLSTWSDIVWRLAHSQNLEVRMKAAKALASIEDGRLGEMGRSRLCEDDFCAERSDEIELFNNNFLPGDEKIILKALERAKSKSDDLHYLGMRALKVCEANPDARLAEVAIFIYRTTPCTLCRGDIVAWMNEQRCLPAWIANEARFDASEETRRLLAA